MDDSGQDAPPAEPEVSFAERIRRSCLDPSFFLLPLRESGGQAVRFVVKIVLLLILLQSVVIGYSTYRISGEISENLSQNLPEIVFRDGDLDVKNQVPHKVPLYEDFNLLLDPAGERNRRQLEKNTLMVAVDGGLFLRMNDSFQFVSTRGYTPGEEGAELTIDSNLLEGWLGWLPKMMVGAVILSLAVENTILATMRIFLISVGGLLARDSEEKKLSWRDILKISCYGVVPLLLIRAGLFISGLTLPYADLLLLVGGTIWIYVIVTQLEDINFGMTGSNMDLEG